MMHHTSEDLSELWSLIKIPTATTTVGNDMRSIPIRRNHFH